MSKRKPIPYILFGLGLMLLAVGFGIKLLGDESGIKEARTTTRNCVQPASVSFEVPELNLLSLEKEPVNLERFRGKTILLNAWATWCPPCLAELPDLEAYYQEHRDEDLVLIGVNIGESASVVQKFLQENPISFPVWLDPDEQTLRALNTISLPYSILIDNHGEVQLAWSGATCVEALESAVTPILRQ
ncbi:MAG: TlpA disulfide reductase family protein [Anaerolineales bacterium]|jgi:thiol-disulfide isomerase/thioredoxin